ncbi:T9SS type A sorting domain-containing protein [Cryomorphaceae bacterium]|nr:T9SS type A sorting domain-containing protein [Cryomorphaceae bacterium]
MRQLLTGILFLYALSSIAQPDIALGSWGNELPYNKVIDIVVRPDEVVVAAENGLFYYGRQFRNLERESKIDGLSGVVITAMTEHAESGTLVVAYDNQIIDVIQGEQQSTYFDIQRFTISGGKTINDILPVGDRMFFSCDFGVVEFNIQTREFDGPYFIGDAGTQVVVNEMSTDGQFLFAATEDGLYTADLNDPNLRDFNAWSLDQVLGGPINTLAYFDGGLYVNKPGEVFNTDTIYSNKSGGWIPFTDLAFWRRNSLAADDDYLMECTTFGFTALDKNFEKAAGATQGGVDYPFYITTIVQGDPEFGEFFLGTRESGLVRHWNGFLNPNYFPEGPQVREVFDVVSRGDEVWVAPGGVDGSFLNLFNSKPIQIKREGEWIPSDQSIQDSAFDMIEIAFDPIDQNVIWGASYSRGLMRWNADGTLHSRYDYTNSILEEKNGQAGFTNIGGLDFDSQSRLWMTNSSTENPLVVRTRNNEWFNYGLGGLAPSTLPIKSVMVDNSDQVWVQLRNDGIVVFNHNNTLANPNDDQQRKLGTATGQGALSSRSVLSMATDKNGAVWVGTNQGVVTFFSPERIFTGQNFDAQHVLIEQNGSLSKLLENEAVTSIAIDGGNRKWFGTARSGVFVMSPDGTEELLHFTEENSPLFSNSIQAIGINPDHGEVYISTDRGMISYRGGATEGQDTFGDVMAFPNPVKPGFSGDIAIRGLAENANVKITDISGNLVFETTALGGQALWNGQSFSGRDVATGVYLVFLTNDDGSETAVTKIMIVR